MNEDATENRGKSEVSDQSDVEILIVASDEERSVRQNSNYFDGQNESSRSSSEGEEDSTSLPPNKRRKFSSDRRFEALEKQMTYLSGYLSQLPQYLTNMTNDKTAPAASDNLASSGPGTSSSNQYLVKPGSNKINLGTLNTDFDEKKIIAPAKEERLEELKELQHFNTQGWKGMRYKKTLHEFLATPGFENLKINEELLHFGTTKDYLAGTENLLAGLTNANLEHRELLQQGLQEILNWSERNPELNSYSLFEKMMTLLGPGSPVQKCSEKIMQIICGKRGECIEIRRERILKEMQAKSKIGSLILYSL